MFMFVRRFRYSIIIFTLLFVVILMYMSSQNIFNLGNEQDVLKWYNYSQDLLNGPDIPMDDPRLIQKIKRFLIKPDIKTKNPSDHPYKLSDPNVKDQSMGQGAKIRKILQNRTNGFFIEVGALDGETRSNTLYFERYLNWTGLLIEPDPLNFVQLVDKNRRSWISPTCLSIRSYPEIVLFEQNQNIGKIADAGSSTHNGPTIYIQCFPFYTYLLALNVTHIDYFSLDVEGAELDVLKTIPFKDINIETLSVEYIHVPGGKDAVSEFMFSQGYVVDSEVTHPDWLANDFIFIKM